MANTKRSTVMYTCYQWDTSRPRGREYVGDCEPLTNVADVKAHQEEVLHGSPFDARNHLLNIDYLDENGECIKREGGCLPDMVIDVEGETVKHFLDAQVETNEVGIKKEIQ